MASFKSCEGPLFDTAPDEAWLALLDDHFRFGIEIASALGGSRSKGARANTYRGFYLNAGGERRAQCVLKIGYTDAIRRDFEGWQNFMRRQPDRDCFATTSPPLEANFGAMIITDFVGFGDTPIESLADALDKGFPLLSDAVARLVLATLAPLHQARRTAGNPIPQLARPQHTMLAYWLSPKIRNTTIDRLLRESDQLNGWDNEQVIDERHMVRVANHLPRLLTDAQLQTDGLPTRVPVGAVHGDPNFDNVFVAYSIPPGVLDGLAMIDFEWCSCDPADSPYDDLARVECEALFGRMELPHRRELTLSLAFGDPWLRGGRPLVANRVPEQDIYASVEIIRRRAEALAHAAGGKDIDDFQRGYLVTLLGQAIRYVAYDGPSTTVRAEALFFCQLVAARLALAMSAGPAARFPTKPCSVSRGTGIAQPQDDGYALKASSPGAYASLLLDGETPAGDLLITCDVELLRAATIGWFGINLGVDPTRPEASGLSAHVRWSGIEPAKASIQSHTNSRDRSEAYSLSASTLREGPISLTIAVSGAAVTFTLADWSGVPACVVAIRVPAERYTGGIAVTAYACDLLVLRLHGRTGTVDPADDGTAR